MIFAILRGYIYCFIGGVFSGGMVTIHVWTVDGGAQ